MPNAAAFDLPDAGKPDEGKRDREEVTSVPFPLLPSVEPLPAVSQSRVGPGNAAWLTCKSPGKLTANEDAVGVFPLNSQQGLLMVADGLGGHRGGRRASHLVKTLLNRGAKRITSPDPGTAMTISGVVPVPTQAPKGDEVGQDHRDWILNEIERVNQRLLRSRVGSATTLALVEVNGNRVRSYHVGDSEILIVSQRGRLKFSSISHSPIGYAVESGMLTQEEALFHPDRHLVSNVIGSDQMSVELGPWVTLSPRDTVLLASDGLFDNLMQGEIVDCVRKGKLADCVKSLGELARDRMLVPSLDHPSKPDDLSILAYRRTGSAD
ncbi:PP2C family protein-serine/threonine phosphatase [Planctomicrobium sp. SH661]|uniref:PP2C family protein-serine/threonine phosphatase n=1 Tax=Planctomicrobium sp. SH661 TaxID=3448124 RepID=UPI003F5AF09A